MLTEKPVLKLMFAAMIRAAERWKAIKVTEFERRQMAAVRAELNVEYEAQTGLVKPTSEEQHPNKLAQFPKCMHGLLIAAARQARGDALPTMPMRWNHRR